MGEAAGLAVQRLSGQPDRTDGARHPGSLRILTDLQLIVPKDSPNGKRYAVKDLAGELVDAFGFDLTPVYARRGEWAERLIEMKQAREARKRAFDEITIARRAAEEALVLWPSIIPISIAPTWKSRSKA